MIISALAALLANPPGSLAYHYLLSTLFGLLYIVSRSQHRGSGRARAARWMLASGWLLALRLLILAGTTANWLLLVEDATVLPALVHFIDFASVLVFAWVIFFPEINRSADQGLLIGIVVDAVFLAASVVVVRLAPSAPDPTGNAVYLVWRWLTLILAIAAVVGLQYRQSAQWELALSGFLALAVGLGLQIASTGGGDPLSGMLRVTSLLGYPLLTSAGLRTLTVTADEDRTVEERVSSRLQYTESAEAAIADALASLASARNSQELAQRAAWAVAETMRSEYCLLLSSPDSKGNFAIATGYDLIREIHIDGAALDDRQSPVIASALQQGQALSISSRSKSPDIYTLQTVLGLDSTGPALLAPISDQANVYGGLLLLSPYARRSWSEEQQAMLEKIARHLATAFDRMRIDSGDTGEALNALLEAQEQIQRLEQDNTRLVEALHSEGKLDVGHLEVLDFDPGRSNEAEETIAILEAEIERLKSAKPAAPELPTSEEMEQLKDELQLALQELVDARAEITQLESELSEGQGATRMRRKEIEAIASISQELRQPMSSVMGYTDLLLGESVGLLGAMQRKFLERVQTAVERMGGLLNNLVQMTALEAGQLDLEPTRVDAVGCVEDAVELVGPALRDKRQVLRMDLPEEVPEILGDQTAVSQILGHLLRNAISASPEEGEILLSAKIQGSDEDGFLLLSVRDSGESIPPEDLGRVFKRVHDPRQEMIKGLGEGAVSLSLVKGLSEALSGRVWVESDVTAGSTFTVLLPLAPSAPASAEPTDQASPGSASEAP